MDVMNTVSLMSGSACIAIAIYPL